MSKLQSIILDVIIALVITVLVGFGVKTALGWRTAAIANATTVHEQAATATAAGTIATDVSAQATDAHRVDVVITEKRAAYEDQYQALKQSNPVVSSWDDAAIPDELRNLARSRRAARDGPGGDAPGRGADDAATDSGRQPATR